ncbi:MAG: hypothetical protein QOF41_339 [Methylobacteriaceae bacterium]|nr:hypothetical protein [Methylobacteriaceae bacterium]
MRALLLGAAAATLAFAPANAQSLTGFFRGANLDPLAQSPAVLNLTAQSASKMAGGDVNAFNDFFLINGPGKLMVNFDGQLQNKGQVNLPGWIGVAQYSNHDISADIQEGFEKVKARYHMPGAKAGHVTVYKTINTQQLVYDYAVQRTPGSPRCQEYLFTPATGGFQLGMQTACFTTLRTSMRSTAGRPGRAH